MTLPLPRILIVGLGGLGCPVIEHVVREAVAAQCDYHFILAEFDVVERSNLPRQWLYDEQDCGRGKAQLVSDYILQRLPASRTERIGAFIPGTYDLRQVDLIMECSDQPALKFYLNDQALACRIPIVIGGATGWRGFVLPVHDQHSPCLRCVFEDEPADAAQLSCRENGIWGPLPYLVGTLMAQAAQKILRARLGACPPTNGEGAATIPFYDLDLRRGGVKAHFWMRQSDCKGCSTCEETSFKTFDQAL